MKIEIIEASIQDTEIIADFQIKMAWETESYHLNKETVLKGVDAIFKNKDLGQYYIAQIEGKAVASLLITYEWSDWRNSRINWIQSVYVESSFRRKGVFSKFYNYIKAQAIQNKQIGGIRLYVDKTNIPAQKTYTNMGMNGNHYQLFEWMKESN